LIRFNTQNLTVTLLEKVQAVEAVFDGLDSAISEFQQSTSLHCKFGCGKCCFKPDIEATAIEFLPFAHHLYNAGLAEEWWERLKKDEGSLCLILNPTQAGAGLCTEYQHRGLICRLFGYSARVNKYGKKELVTCQIIKGEQQTAFADAEAKIENGLNVPVMNQYYMQLHSIDPDMAREFYPINQAIQRAVEIVMHYYAYRN
jgi:Fe-S-cluster containining protein